MIKIQSANHFAALVYGLKPIRQQKSRAFQNGGKVNTFPFGLGELRISWEKQKIDALFTANSEFFLREISFGFNFRSFRPSSETVLWCESYSDVFPTKSNHPIPSTLSTKPVKDGAWALWLSESPNAEGIFFSQSPPASTPIHFFAHPGKRELRMKWTLNRTVSEGETIILPAIKISTGALEKETRSWRKKWSTLSRREPLTDRRIGWCAGRELKSPKELREMLGVLKTVKPRFEWFAVGPQYAVAPGDWLIPSTPFKDHMGSLSRSINEFSMGPALRLAPFLVSPKSTMAVEKRDWLVKSNNGSPVSVPGYAGDRALFYVLDITHNAVVSHIHHMFTVMRDRWGFRSFIIERMMDSAVAGIRQDGLLEIGSLLVKAAMTIRNSVGNKVMLSASDLPLLTTSGIWNSQSVVPISDLFPANSFHYQKSMSAASAMLHRSRWKDSGLVLCSGLLPIQLFGADYGTAAQTMLNAVALVTGMIMLSGDPRSMDRETAKFLENFLSLSEECRKGKLNILPNLNGGRVVPLVVRNDRGWVALFNFSEKKKSVSLDRTGMKSELGILSSLSTGDGSVYNSPKIDVTLPPYGYRLFRA